MKFIFRKKRKNPLNFTSHELWRLEKKKNARAALRRLSRLNVLVSSFYEAAFFRSAEVFLVVSRTLCRVYDYLFSKKRKATTEEEKFLAPTQKQKFFGKKYTGDEENVEADVGNWLENERTCLSLPLVARGGEKYSHFLHRVFPHQHTLSRLFSSRSSDE